MRAAPPGRHRRMLAIVALVAALAVGAATGSATRDPAVPTARPASDPAEPLAGVPRHLRAWLVRGPVCPSRATA